MKGSRWHRLAWLEKAFAPSVLNTFRFVTHVTVEPNDPRCGTHEHVSHPGVSIAELIIYTATREAYKAQVRRLEERYTMLEG